MRFCGFLLGAGYPMAGETPRDGKSPGAWPWIFSKSCSHLNDDPFLVSDYSEKERRRGKESPFQPRSTIRVVIVFVVLLAYSFALEYLGFVVVSFLLMAYLFRAFGGSRRWYVAVLLALTSVGMTYLLFEVLLEGNLPKGVFGV